MVSGFWIILLSGIILISVLKNGELYSYEEQQIYPGRAVCFPVSYTHLAVYKRTEKTMASLKKREYTSQMINPPIILTLSGNEELMLKKYMEHFTASALHFPTESG